MDKSIIILFAFIFGAVVGSFLNVCIHRLPRGKSIVFPPSHCPHCDHPLKIMDLIPILGYLSLGGKCRYCQKKISWRYPLVELLTGTIFAAVAYSFPLYEVLFLCPFVAICLAILFIDLEHQIIPDVLSFVGIGLGLLYNLRSWNLFLSAGLGMALGYLILNAIGYFGKLAFKKEAIGEGDFFLAAMLGAFLGWQGVILAIFLAYFLAAIAIFPFILFRKLKLGQYIAFGPALVVAGLITLFWGNQIISWYVQTFLGL